MFKYFIIASIALFACSTAVNNKNNMQSASEDIITVKEDSTFSIQLKCSTGEGFSWYLKDSMFNNIALLKQQFVPASSKDGGEDVQLFYFKAVNIAEEKLQFIYRQAFINPTPSNAPIKNYLIKIINN